MTDKINLARHALDAGIAAATLNEPKIDHPDGRSHVLIPDGFKLEDVSPPHLLPDHIRQKVTVDDLGSMIQYAKRFADTRSIIIADYDAGTIAAHLDWHGANNDVKACDHVSHSVTLKLRDSEEYKRWNKAEGDLHSQEEFAIFIEENVHDVTDPEPGVLIEICRDLEASQGVAFRSGVRLENGDRTFRYETETKIKSEISVPTEIGLSIPLYNGEPPTDIRAKFRFRPTPQGLMLGFRWHRVEYRRQATFVEMATKAVEETGLPVFYGRPA